MNITYIRLIHRQPQYYYQVYYQRSNVGMNDVLAVFDLVHLDLNSIKLINVHSLYSILLEVKIDLPTKISV